MKPWHADIERHIAIWSQRLGHLNWWPRFVYHFTDVRNAASVLQSGNFHSRAEATRLGLMQVDNASSEIIGQTRSERLEFVRLYFRPRTPTQFRNEGIRPRGQQELDAHCPVPVYFCFDAQTILSNDDTQFSDGNMASARVSYSGERDFFLNIPFERVFHEGAIRQGDDKTEIIFRRNAEVLVPSRLPLEPGLKYVVCRSAAERQTLLQLLPASLRQRWIPLVRVIEQGLFYRQWTYVEQVVTLDDAIVFRFNPDSRTPGPFAVVFSYREKGEGPERTWRGRSDDIRSDLTIQVPAATEGVVTLYLDDSLAFAGTVNFDKLPI